MNISGSPDDAGRIDPESAPPYSDLAYLSGFGEKAWHLHRERREKGRVHRQVGWKHIQTRVVLDGAVRYKGCSLVGQVPMRLRLEPWTNRWRSNPHEGIEAGEWLRLEKGESVETKLEAEGFQY
jgi:hypothetical protein